jgi:NADPH:quinone reductase-like Zn-dependent oxidoreductase
VAALMGDLGRTINGSYAEYTCPLATNVRPIETELSWEDFAVIPESYATAWTCLHRNLEIAKGQTLVIRGATSALGRAAVNIAVDAGAYVIATTRKKQRFEALKELGAHRAEIETPSLSELIPERKQIDAVLDLVGNTTFMDSLRMLRRRGRMRLAGWLGGLDPVSNFNPLCFRCQAEFTSPFLAALCSVLQTFRCRTFLFKPSLIKPQMEFIERSPLESFNLMIFARRTRRWNRTKPMAKWWFESEGV